MLRPSLFLAALLIASPCVASTAATIDAPSAMDASQTTRALNRAPVDQAPRQTTFASRRIQVEARGSGPDIILIPGLASTPAVWERTAAALQDRYRVHLVSIRGFGDLAAEANASGLVGEPVATEISRYIAEQRLNAPSLIGHSMGGQIALRVASDPTAGVSRVMVVDASPFFPSLVNAGATTGDVEPLAMLAYQAVMLLGDEALKMQGERLGLELGGAADQVFGAMGWQGGDRRTLAQSLYEVMTTDLRSRLSSIRAPVTVVYGWSADPNRPRSRIDSLISAGYRSLPTPARFERIEGAEHMVMIDRPRPFMAAVERFMR